MDQIDSKMIKILQDDGRISNAKIARKVGVSEATVRRRLNHLIQEKYIHILAIADQTKMGLNSQAIIGIQVDPDKIEEVADALMALDKIKWVTVTTGSYDIFTWASLDSSETLGIFLRTKIGVIPGVRRTETFVSLDKRGGEIYL